MAATRKRRLGQDKQGMLSAALGAGAGISKLTSTRQVTIPAALGRAVGLKRGHRVIMRVDADGPTRLQRLRTFAEIAAAVPRVPPIDWKAAREEMAEEIARKIERDRGIR